MPGASQALHLCGHQLTICVSLRAPCCRCSAHKSAGKASATVDGKDPEAAATEGPIVHAKKGKRFLPVLEMLRFHWLPGEPAQACLTPWLVATSLGDCLHKGWPPVGTPDMSFRSICRVGS